MKSSFKSDRRKELRQECAYTVFLFTQVVAFTGFLSSCGCELLSRLLSFQREGRAPFSISCRAGLLVMNSLVSVYLEMS